MRVYGVFAALAAVLIAAAGCSKEQGHPAAGTTDEEFGKSVCGSLPYRIRRINVSEATKPIMVLYLHGGSSKGSDNELQMKELAIGDISEFLESHAVPSIFVVPQCPASDSWGAKMNPQLEALIDECGSGCDGVYVLGGSMGGTGTWSLANACPSRIRGIMPVAGKPGTASATNFKSMRVRSVMSEADEMMKSVCDDVLSFCERINAAGGEAVCTIIPAAEQWSHQTTCEQSYTDERLRWLLGL